MACGLLFPDDQDGFLVTRFSATLGRVLGACALLCSWAGSATTADDRIPLRVWGMHMGVSRFGWYAVIEEFERLHPNVRVVIGPTDRGQDLQKLLSGVVGNSPPDVFRRETLLLGDIAARDILMPLDEFADRHKDQQFAINPDDYYRGAWEQCFYDGHLYAIPEGAITLVLSYNRELFRKAGLDPDRPPRTWDEWRDCTEKLTIKDDEGNITQGRLGDISRGAVQPGSGPWHRTSSDTYRGQRCHHVADGHVLHDPAQRSPPGGSLAVHLVR